jgi:hypothetical protein
MAIFNSKLLVYQAGYLWFNASTHLPTLRLRPVHVLEDLCGPPGAGTTGLQTPGSNCGHGEAGEASNKAARLSGMILD